jgi:4-hydroxy-3-methylbut-2-enyl diphosphate reductase
VGLAVAEPDRLAFVVAPGADVGEVSRVLAVLRERFPRLRGQHPGEWCCTVADLRTAARSAVAEADLVLVTGPGTSPASAVTGASARAQGVPVHAVAALRDLTPDAVAGSTVVLVEAGPGERVRGEVAEVLTGLGPWSAVVRRTSSRPVAPLNRAAEEPEPSEESTVRVDALEDGARRRRAPVGAQLGDHPHPGVVDPA